MADIEAISQIEECVETAISSCGYKLGDACGSKEKVTVTLMFANEVPSAKQNYGGDCSGKFMDQKVVIGIEVQQCKSPSVKAIQVARKIENKLLHVLSQECECARVLNYIGTIKQQTQKKGHLYWEREYMLTYYDPTAIL